MTECEELRLLSGHDTAANQKICCTDKKLKWQSLNIIGFLGIYHWQIEKYEFSLGFLLLT